MRTKKLIAGLLSGMGAFIIIVWLFLMYLLLFNGATGSFTAQNILYVVLPVLLGIDAMAAGIYFKNGKSIKVLMLIAVAIVVALIVLLVVVSS